MIVVLMVVQLRLYSYVCTVMIVPLLLHSYDCTVMYVPLNTTTNTIIYRFIIN